MKKKKPKKKITFPEATLKLMEKYEGLLVRYEEYIEEFKYQESTKLLDLFSEEIKMINDHLEAIHNHDNQIKDLYLHVKQLRGICGKEKET